jgi:hypothetical protein
MNLEASDLRDDGTASGELDLGKQIQTFVDEHPLLSLAFMVALGYAAGRIISKL